MDKLRAIKLFVRLADVGSFTRVAEEINASKSMISKEITRLEDDIGARLLHRSTRNLQLTPVGEGYLQHCREILIKLADAESYVSSQQTMPKGRLRINAPMALGVLDLATLFAEFMKQYPDVELDIHLNDEPIDLIEQGFDLGFRVSSRLMDSSYIGRPLTQFTYKVCAARAYLDAHEKIQTPDDLAGHNCFIYSYFQGRSVWPLGEGVAVKGKLRVNSTPFMMECIKAGLGVGFIPSFVCRKMLAEGEVEEILPDAERPKLTLYALYPARHHLPPPLIKCVTFLQQWFQNQQKAL
ncbi:LysR family transcriptional regulator [Hahella sp. CCB-MM4]|uniref:LysR family transcriptional regulator n=1 Tax=Hahella sp. (strain CCB-MM4) TaxID=1926491 RepID=UPI000B9A8B84|nr:LysR family transcriptional regulator [Hahella sp. CCB-MM4]OZG73541.1 LysR family transcriptional regulator [Hahella sp. CCB-MM4]